MKEKVRALAASEWKKSHPRIKGLEKATWDLRLTPPLPEEWMNAGLPMSVYAFSAGTESDSVGRYETIAKPWAKLKFVLSDPSSLKLERLPGGENSIGHQGIRPLTESELNILHFDIYDSYAALDAPGGRPEGLEPQIRNFYKVWKNTEGLIAELVLKMHPKIAAKIGI